MHLTYLLTYYLLTYLFTYLLTYLLTYSMQHSPWEANRFAASQEILHILWNLKIHYRFHRCPPHFPILSHLDPGHTWRFILILSSHLPLRLSVCLFSSGFPTKTLYTPLLSPICSNLWFYFNVNWIYLRIYV